MSISFLKSIAYKSLVVGIVPLMVACGGGGDNNGSNNNGGGNTPAIVITSPEENQNFLIGKYYREENITYPLTATAQVKDGTGNEELSYQWSIVSTNPADQEGQITLENSKQKDARYKISKNYDQEVDVTFKVTVTDINNSALSKDKEITVHLKQPKIQLKVTDGGSAQNKDGDFYVPFSVQVIFPDYMEAAGYDQVTVALGANDGSMNYNLSTLYKNNNLILNIEQKEPIDPLLYRTVIIHNITSSKAGSNWYNIKISNKVHNLFDAINGKDVSVIGDPVVAN